MIGVWIIAHWQLLVVVVGVCLVKQCTLWLEKHGDFRRRDE